MERRVRRALSQQGGPRRAWGEPSLRNALERALDAAAKEPVDVLTHNLHAWPARMHPWLARILLEELAREGARVLDPFAGSGTTLVEAQRAGVPSLGVDLNPLARRVAEVKCRITDEGERAAFLELLQGVVERSHQRVKERRPARAPLPPPEARRYEGHVLRELAGLYEELQALPESIDRRCLEVLLTAMVVKFSKQRADTATDEVHKRIGRHVPTRFFERRGHELVERWAAYAAEVPPHAPRARFLEGDVRDLSRLVEGERFQLVISSPPYGGTYDYVEHHARRFPWLGLDARAFEKKEIGARRRLSRAGESAATRWQREVRAFLASMAAVLEAGATAVLVMGDGEVGGRRVDAEEQIRALGASAGLELIAAASEERTDWMGRRPRREHLLALVRTEETPTKGPPPRKSGDEADPRTTRVRRVVRRSDARNAGGRSEPKREG